MFTTPREAQRAEVVANFAAFEAALPDLLRDRLGWYAVFRHQRLVDFFETFPEALAYCISSYSDRLFSIQEVTDESLNLWWLPDASADSALRSAKGSDN